MGDIALLDVTEHDERIVLLWENDYRALLAAQAVCEALAHSMTDYFGYWSVVQERMAAWRKAQEQQE